MQADAELRKDSKDDARVQPEPSSRTLVGSVTVHSEPPIQRLLTMARVKEWRELQGVWIPSDLLLGNFSAVSRKGRDACESCDYGPGRTVDGANQSVSVRLDKGLGQRGNWTNRLNVSFVAIQQRRDHPDQKNRSRDEIEEILNEGVERKIQHGGSRMVVPARNEKEWRHNSDCNEESAIPATTQHREGSRDSRHDRKRPD